MLPRGNRLRRRADFVATVRSGRRAGRPALVVHLDTRPAAEQPRLGFVVGRQVGGAVTRNLVSRRLRHLARARLDRLPRSATVVVRAQPPAAVLAAAELGRQLDEALRRVLGDGYVTVR